MKTIKLTGGSTLHVGIAINYFCVYNFDQKVNFVHTSMIVCETIIFWQEINIVRMGGGGQWKIDNIVQNSLRKIQFYKPFCRRTPPRWINFYKKKTPPAVRVETREKSSAIMCVHTTDEWCVNDKKNKTYES